MVRAGVIHGTRLQEASPGGFNVSQRQGGKGTQRLEPGEAVLGSRVRQLLLPAFRGWVQLIAPHHRRVELLHTHPMGVSLPWQLIFQGRQEAAPWKAAFPSVFGEGRTGSICTGHTWFWEWAGASCPVRPVPLASTGGGSSGEHRRSYRTCHGLLFLGHITPNLAGRSSCLPRSRDGRHPVLRGVFEVLIPA